MNISTLSQNYYQYGDYRAKSKPAAQSEETASSSGELESLLSLSASKPSGPPPAPPEEMDFESMSDSDLRDFLSQMQEMTGSNSIPGIEDGTAVEDLTEDQLASIRDSLASMSEGMKVEGRRMPPRPPEGISSVSDEELTSILDMIQNATGSIPGVEDSEELSVYELTEEQLSDARESLYAQQQEHFQTSIASRMEEMMQSGGGALIMANMSVAYA